jgi:hypothetical protein
MPARLAKEAETIIFTAHELIGLTSRTGISLYLAAGHMLVSSTYNDLTTCHWKTIKKSHIFTHSTEVGRFSSSRSAGLVH